LLLRTLFLLVQNCISFNPLGEWTCFDVEQMKTSENMRELFGRSRQAIKVLFVVG
jgi:hypothetical protein